MRTLQPFCVKFQVANEPNHLHRIEGWGCEDDDARSFNTWFLEAYTRLKEACPWASIGFPGLAIPDFAHRDRTWLEICRPAIQRADWLGVHCYWQTPPDRPGVMLDEQFGLTFKHYHRKYPDKTLEILECGNSNVQNNLPISDDAIAGEYVTWLQEVFKHDYINSASFFILSSQDVRNWGFFSWRTESGFVKPVVHRVQQMHRPALRAVHAPPPAPEAPPPVEIQPGQYTNQHIITAFHNAAVKLGLGNWDLMALAGIKLSDLVRDRNAPYSGTPIDQLPNLTETHRQLIRLELASLTRPRDIERDIGPGAEAPRFLWQRADLATVSLALPRSEHITLASTPSNAEKRVARVWNWYGYLLLSLADALELDPGVVAAVLASEAERRGVAGDGRMVIRFENHVFFDRWGRDNPEKFSQHFRFDASRPWQKHQWRPTTDEAWRDCHATQSDEWEVFEFASSLDETAARLSTGMGLSQIMGFNHASIGYESVGQMFDAFCSGERYQILGLFDFIGGPSADSRELNALRARDFDTFAALHHGIKEASRYGSTIRRLYDAFQRLEAA